MSPLDQPVGFGLVVLGALTVPAMLAFFWVQGIRQNRRERKSTDA